jgi:hypothetical protein
MKGMPMKHDAAKAVFEVCCMQVMWMGADPRHLFPFMVRRTTDGKVFPESQFKTKGDAISWICDNHDFYHVGDNNAEKK